MIRNYFLTALRHLRKNKLYSIINILGLTTGLAACLLIGVYIQHELSYDKFHEKADRIVRVTMEYRNAGTLNTTATTGTRVGPEFKRVFPSVEEYARTFLSQAVIKKGEKAFDEPRVLFADPGFLKMFSFKLVEGDRNAALDAPGKIVLTKSMAKKYFGTDKAINQTLTAFGRDLTVSGICEDVPTQSQVKFDFITPFENLGPQVKEEKWWEANWITYLLLSNKENIPVLQQQVSAYMKTGEIRRQARLEGNDYLTYYLEPLTSVHLHSVLAGFEPNGNMTYIYMFGVIAILILVIASANYTNLATAQSTGRGNEIGMRKVLGASKKQVFMQFIGESAVITFLSAALALGLCIYLIPLFNQVAGKTFTAGILWKPAPVILLIAFAILVTFFAGFYPALILSGTRVISILKKGFRITGGSGVLRRSLIVVQFSISVFLVIYTVIIWQQMRFLQVKNLGYDKDHVAILPIGGKMRSEFKSIRDAIQQVPGVEGVTAAYETPEFVEWSDGISVTDENGTREISLQAMPVDLDFTKTMKMQLSAGRDFIESDFALMDTSNDYANYRQPFMINESLAKKIGWSPEEAIGRTIQKGAPGPVVGVVKDFNFSSLKEPIGPMLIFLGRDFSRSFMVRINGHDLKHTLGRLEMLWKQRVPDRPFNYHFLDEDYDKLYVGEQRSAALFTVAATLAIVLACLGLFGLAAFSTQQRTKEIGIRRVLGAGLIDITILFSKNFLIMIGIAVLIALPTAWYAGRNWLSDFAYRVSIGWWVFVFAVAGIAALSLITVGWHVIKAAIANPVKSLRTE